MKHIVGTCHFYRPSVLFFPSLCHFGYIENALQSHNPLQSSQCDRMHLKMWHWLSSKRKKNIHLKRRANNASCEPFSTQINIHYKLLWANSIVNNVVVTFGGKCLPTMQKYSKGLHKLFKLLFPKHYFNCNCNIKYVMHPNDCNSHFQNPDYEKFQAPHPFESETHRERKKNESKTQLWSMNVWNV